MPKSRSTSKPKAQTRGLAVQKTNDAPVKAENEVKPPTDRLIISDEDAVKNLEEVAGILTTMHEQLNRLSAIVEPAVNPLEAVLADHTAETGNELLSTVTAYEQQMICIAITLGKASRLSAQRKKASWLARDFRRLSGLSMRIRNTEFMADQFKEAIVATVREAL